MALAAEYLGPSYYYFLIPFPKMRGPPTFYALDYFT